MESPYYEMTHDFEEENRLFHSGYVKGYHDAVMKCPDIVRSKDCVHRGKSEKCVLAAISEEKNFPLFMLDNRGEWFCADGERKEDR